MFFAPVTGEPAMLAHVGTVIGGENDVGVVQFPSPPEKVEHTPHRVVYLLDAAQLVAPPLQDAISL